MLLEMFFKVNLRSVGRMKSLFTSYGRNTKSSVQCCYNYSSLHAKRTEAIANVQANPFLLKRWMEDKSHQLLCGCSSTASHENSTVVYTGQLTTMVKAVKFFSLSTSVMGLAMQPFLMTKLMTHGWFLAIFTETIVFCYAILTPVILHLICKRYVVSLQFDKNTKTFTAVTLSLFFRKKQLHFTAEDVLVPDIVGPFTSFLAKGKPLLLNPNLFEDQTVYMHLMGYDKPLDFKLNEKKE